MTDTDSEILPLISAYMDHWRSANIPALLSMYSSDIRYHDMSTGEMVEYGDLEPFLRDTFASESQSTLEFRGLVHLEGNTAFIHWTQQLNALDTNKAVDVSGVELIVFQHGKIVSVHEFYDFREIGRESETKDAGSSQLDQMSKMGFDAEKAASIASEIGAYFARHKPYLQSDLNLLYVSERLGYTRNQISYIINHVVGCSFYDFVNKHRIDHVIEHMSGADNNASIIELAIDAGFNSISGFYKAFKKQTGKTPTALRKSMAGRQQ
jgi:AraC-like DNA-binding protein